MNFKEAYEKLEKLANGKYFSLDYGIVQYHTGEKVQKCSVYIGGEHRIFQGTTWDSAFDALLNGVVYEVEPIEEQGEL